MRVLALLLVVVGCGSRSTGLTDAELAEARPRLAKMRAEVATYPAGKRRFGVVVEPFGSQRPDAVQAFVNTRATALAACLPGLELDVIVAWNATKLRDVAVVDRDGNRQAPAERCLRGELDQSRLAQPVSPGMLYLVPTAL
jgi:hypothetical protein